MPFSTRWTTSTTMLTISNGRIYIIRRLANGYAILTTVGGPSTITIADGFPTAEAAITFIKELKL